ncbi:MAG: spoVG [Clostridia bacterium]|nr:spoVG [Clostridia bacterium]
MTITSVNIRKLNDHEKMKAIVSVTFDNMLVIHDIKVINGQDRRFIAMPSRKTWDGHFTDIVHPITAELRTTLEEEILTAYDRALEEQGQEQESDQESDQDLDQNQNSASDSE